MSDLRAFGRCGHLATISQKEAIAAYSTFFQQSKVAIRLSAREFNRCATLRCPLRLDAVPDHDGNVRAAQAFDGADSRRRGHVDFGEAAIDHVDAGKHEPTLPQRRPKPLAD